MIFDTFLTVHIFVHKVDQSCTRLSLEHKELRSFKIVILSFMVPEI